MKWNVEQLNQAFRNASPNEILAWVKANAKNPLLTVNFRPKSAVLIHAVVKVIPEIPVLWVDSGYNTSYTYRHALELTQLFQLNIKCYSPLQTAAFRNIYLGIPDSESSDFKRFSEEVKLEPFRRGMNELQPDLWLAHLLHDQTAEREKMDIFSLDQEGRLKVSPFYHWNADQIDNYLAKYELPSEERYYDPAKPALNKECGIHA